MRLLGPLPVAGVGRAAPQRSMVSIVRDLLRLR